VDGDGVTLSSVPHYIGPAQYLRKIFSVRYAIAAGIDPTDSVVLRVPGNVGTVASRILRRRGQPFAVEVVGDPWDVFSKGASHHPLRPLFQRWSSGALKGQCASACAALYVTERTLQKRYPPPIHRSGTSEALEFDASDVEMPEGVFRASNVEMPESAFVAEPRFPRAESRRFRMVCIASLEQPYKGHDVLLDAMAWCVRRGLDCELVLVGDGKIRRNLEHQVGKLGLEGRVFFLGQLAAGEAVRDEVDKGDLFVLPSRVEGMPRALIEAMGRGLPCVASAVGGVPEVLPAEALVPADDAVRLGELILAFAKDPALRNRMSHQNLIMAQKFRESELRPKREAFYRAVKEAARARTAAA
jgi:glycosyltransferase involved in cell wall biosynthesis